VGLGTTQTTSSPETRTARQRLPNPLSPDISLGLFRVLQEALHDSMKHSGTRQFEVRLWGTSDEIDLTVKDSGVGFDREAAKMSRGLGLISMEERLKLLNATLSIESQPIVEPRSMLAFLWVRYAIRCVLPGKSSHGGSLFPANLLEDLLIFLAVKAAQ
jgi:signal transduction histidine kinase